LKSSLSIRLTSFFFIAGKPCSFNIKHATAFGFLGDDVLGLFFRPYVDHRLPLCDQVFHKLAGFPEELQRLLEIDNVNAVAGIKNVLFHLGVPPLGLVSEMNPGLKKLFHRDGRHIFLLQGFSLRPPFDAGAPDREPFLQPGERVYCAPKEALAFILPHPQRF
jgi:hypothetical protein